MLDWKLRFRHLQPGSYSLSIYIPGTGEILQTVEITPSFADPKGRVEKKFVFDEQTLQAQVRAVHRGVISVPKPGRSIERPRPGCVPAMWRARSST